MSLPASVVRIGSVIDDRSLRQTSEVGDASSPIYSRSLSNAAATGLRVLDGGTAMRQDLLQALEHWRAFVDRKPRTYESYWFNLRAMSEWGLVRASDVTPESVGRWVRERRGQGIGPGTINIGISALCAALKALVQTEEIDEALIAKVRRFRIKVKAKPRLRAAHLNPARFVRLCARSMVIAPRLLLPLELGAFAGLRAGELARTHADNVHLDEIDARRGSVGFLDVVEMPEWGRHGTIKTGSARRVPLCFEIRELLRAAIPIARERHGGWLFPSWAMNPLGRGRPPKQPFMTGKTLSLLLRRVVTDTEFAGTTWHTIRHTRASWWAQADVSLAKVAFWLGNSVEVVEKYYASLKPGYDSECERMPT